MARPDRRMRGEAEGPARLHGPVLAALACALLIPLLFLQPVQLVEARLFDLFSTLAPPLPPEPGAVIVAIDEPAFQEIGRRWPWPRSLHAELVRRLRAAGAKVIALDIVFAEPSEEAADAALAAALAPDAVLAADDVATPMPQGIQTTRVAPLDAFLEAGASSGTASVDLDGDGVLRRLPAAPDLFALETLRRAGTPAEPAPEGALIQFFGPPRTYPTVSYYQALDPARFLPPGTFKDRIVLVGLSLKSAVTPESATPDLFLTPYTLTSRSATAGVEVQATILDNLRHRLFMVPLAPWAMAALVAAAAGAAALFLRGRSSWRTGIVTLLGVVLILGGAWALLRFGRIWAPPAVPVLAVLAVVGAQAGLDFARERRMRRAIVEAFSRYLAPDLVAELARNPASLKLGGERKNLTVLFCDVRGFTTLSERLKDEPERLTALINRLLDALSGAVMAEGGTIDKYMGDCVMAFWNAPLSTPDHPVRAVRAALGMVEAVRRLNEELRAEGPDGAAPGFAVGVGINTGDCVVGNLGSRWRYDYSVLGDTVNTASRLEGLSKDYGVSIILGPDTAERVRERYVVVELDRIAVRGRAAATAISTVVGPREGDGPAAIEALHARVLASLGSGATGEPLDLLARARSLAPSLAPYYDRIERRLRGTKHAAE